MTEKESPIYARYADAITTGALTAASRDAPYGQPWERAMYAAGHRLAFADRIGWELNAAGLIAAHCIRLDEEDSPLDDIAWQLGSRDADTRIDAANQLRQWRSAEPYTMVWRWLSARDDGQAASTSGHLARHVATGIDRYRRALAPAWYATAGRYLLGTLGRTDPAPGPMSADDRAALQPAIRGCWTARMWTKTQLASDAGISRPTLDAWIEDQPSRES